MKRGIQTAEAEQSAKGHHSFQESPESLKVTRGQMIRAVIQARKRQRWRQEQENAQGQQQDQQEEGAALLAPPQWKPFLALGPLTQEEVRSRLRWTA